MTLSDRIKGELRDVYDFPKPGIVFKDITPLLANPALRKEVAEHLAAELRPLKADALAAVEARGFIFGVMIAHELGIPFIPVRKAGKLPFHKVTEEYDLEYGRAKIEMHNDAFEKGSRIIIHDDLLATGGTASAAGRMIQHLGGEVAGYSF
ncbi:MAG TPA: adenine phosphoribosyltransferase, partial [Cyclobacteriaceae bacterium]|nr:adenine phosphoribosyltransferase [Cyclobacteriaceae bacterium]